MKIIKLLQTYLSTKRKKFGQVVRDVVPELLMLVIVLYIILASVLVQRWLVTMEPACS